jgi:hypothetical protein
MAAEPPVRLVDGTFTYKKDGKDKTFVFHANYIKRDDTIQLQIQGYSPTVVGLAEDLLLTYEGRPGIGTYMVIELSRMEYTRFIDDVLNKGIQLTVKNDKKFPGTWMGKIKDEIKDPFTNNEGTNNEGTNNNSSGGRRRTRRRKHKRRSTRRRHHRR